MRQEVALRHDGPWVILAYKGQEIRMSASSARDIARWLSHLAGKAEEIANHEQAVMDQAILYRAGAGIGLLHHPALIHEAAKEAAWNSNLRRFMPGGVKASSKMGAPTLIQTPPKEKRP